jgi:Uma2 family endonuclease
MPAWDLEYMLLFGPPENKLELLDGKTPCLFPFADRATADAHFELWSRTLARWQGIADPPARTVDGMLGNGTLGKEFGKFTLEQYRRPIRLEVPSVLNAYHWAHVCFWRRSLWPMQPAGFETASEWSQDHWDIRHNLWRIFEEAKERLGIEGQGIGGVDISLTATDAVLPDFFFFRGPRDQNLISNQYFRGVPQLIMEVLSPFSRAIDLGPRKEIYRRAGVPQLWLIEPLTRTIELHQLIEDEYRLQATAGVGQALAVPGFDGLTIEADRVFDTQSSRFKDKPSAGDGRPESWAIPRDQVVGLQHLILLGHAERRREIWNNQSPCFLAFGSSEEASHRLDRFLLEASRWEGAAVPKRVEIEPDMETADVGRFHFVRQGHIVRLNVDVSGLLYRELLTVTADRKAWDWGEETDGTDG